MPESNGIFTEDELDQCDVLLIQFHIIHEDDNLPIDDENSEEFVPRGPVRAILSFSIPREQINKENLWIDISNLLTRFNLPFEVAMEVAENISSAAISLVCESSSETIQPIFVEVVFYAYNDSDDADELTHRVGVPASESSIEALEKVEGSGLEEKCVICLVDLSTDSKVARMPCSHFYHEKCIIEWLKKSHLCPLCRFEMPVDSNLNLNPSGGQRLVGDASESES